MEKIYYSENEFYQFDKVNNLKTLYSGYVIIKDGIPYIKSTGEKLLLSDNYITSINLSNEFFDRNLNDKLVLPHDEADCTFAANDFLKASVINNIIKNIDENNKYIFKNCIIPQNNLPLANIIPTLSPLRKMIYRPTGNYPGVYDFETSLENSFQPVSGWIWSNISYDTIEEIRDKGIPYYNDSPWPTTVTKEIDEQEHTFKLEGKDLFTDNLVDAIISPTDMNYDSSEDNSPEKKIFATFLAFTNEIRLMNLYLCNENILVDGEDPLKTSQTNKQKDDQYQKRDFIKLKENSETYFAYDNLKIKSFKNIDPNDKNSLKFKQITCISKDGDYLYVVDSELNGIFKYDISRCLSYHGAATNKITLLSYLQGEGTLEDNSQFNNPISISAFNNKVAVLDKNNLCIKIYDQYFNLIFKIIEGGFVGQDPYSVSICPYDFFINGQLLNAGAIIVTSVAGSTITLDIYDKEGNYITNKAINNIEIIDKKWLNPDTGNVSSSTPIHFKETIKKIVFSANNSNFFYIVTDKKLIKIQLSKITNPLGVVEYGYKVFLNKKQDTWSSVSQAWEHYLLNFDTPTTWEETEETVQLIQGINKCYAITSIDGINADIVLNIIDNHTNYSDGKVHRVDTYKRQRYDTGRLHRYDNEKTNHKLLYYDSDNRLTYVSSGNKPVLVEPWEIMDRYINENNVPVKDGNNQFYPIKKSSINNNFNVETIQKLLYVKKSDQSITYESTNTKPLMVNLGEKQSEYYNNNGTPTKYSDEPIEITIKNSIDKSQYLYYDISKSKPVLTYSKYNEKLGKENTKVLAYVGEIVDEYQQSYTGLPFKTGNTIEIKSEYTVANDVSNTILLYKEPNTFKSTLLDTNLKLYTLDELIIKNNEEYYDQLTFNKILYKLLFNLIEIKKYISGTFAAGYSTNNILTFDHVEINTEIQQVSKDLRNFIVGENEQTSIILNRCLKNIYKTQVNILEKMNVTYMTNISYNVNNFNII